MAGVVAFAYLRIASGISTVGDFMGFVTVIWGESFPAVGLFHYISCQEHLHSFTKGLIDTRPVVYNVTMGAFLLFLTHHVVDYRRWKR